jgi:hypothetical protein
MSHKQFPIPFPDEFHIGDRVRLVHDHSHPRLKAGDCGKVVGFDTVWLMTMQVEFDEGTYSRSHTDEPEGWDKDRFEKIIYLHPAHINHRVYKS